eukprot:1045706-Rhodomonas_salina.1
MYPGLAEGTRVRPYPGTWCVPGTGRYPGTQGRNSFPGGYGPLPQAFSDSEALLRVAAGSGYPGTWEELQRYGHCKETAKFSRELRNRRNDQGGAAIPPCGHAHAGFPDLDNTTQHVASISPCPPQDSENSFRSCVHQAKLLFRLPSAPVPDCCREGKPWGRFTTSSGVRKICAALRQFRIGIGRREQQQHGAERSNCNAVERCST